MRTLLQRNPEEHSRVIKKMAKLLDSVKVPVGRASIVWVIGEFAGQIPRVAPDALRNLAKSFINEVGCVPSLHSYELTHSFVMVGSRCQAADPDNGCQALRQAGRIS